MALIHCPECGHEISDSVKSCPNCGIQITVCPECGKVFSGEREQCDNCGFQISKAPAAADMSQIIPKEYKACTLEIRWENQMSTGRAISRIISVIDTVCIIAALVLSVAVIVTYIVWRVKSTDERLLTIISNYDTIKGFVITACVTFGLSAIGTFSDDKIDYLLFSRWLNTQKIDGKKFIEENYIDFTSPADIVAAQKITNTLYGAYLNANPNDKTTLTVNCIVNFILCIIAYACLGVAICENLQVLMTAKAFELQLNINDLKFVAAIICAVAFIAKRIFVWKTDGVFNEKCNRWLKSLANDIAH